MTRQLRLRTGPQAAFPPQGTQAGGCEGSSGRGGGSQQKVWTHSPAAKGYTLGRGEEPAKYKEPLSRCPNNPERENLIRLPE